MGLSNSVIRERGLSQSAIHSIRCPYCVRQVTAPNLIDIDDAVLVHRPGRWIDNWNPENTKQREQGGKLIAARNLKWSIFAEFLGFVVWQLWSIVVVSLPTAGFTFSTTDVFWLISMPSLVGATLRFPYTFLVPKFGDRNWTIISAGLLLIPSVALGFSVGNFASTMSNITYFYPQSQKGYALDLVAAKLRETRAEFGADVFGGGGLTNEKAYQLGKFTRVALRSSRIDYNGRFCMSSAAAAGNRAFGLDRGLPFRVDELDAADTILILGSNVAQTMPPFIGHLDGVRAAGGLVVVDPRRTATARLTADGAGMHVQPTSGSDLGLLLGLTHYSGLSYTLLDSEEPAF